VATAAKLRQESRGAHTRDDFEGENEDWGQVNIVIRKGAGGMELEKVIRGEDPPALAAIARASIEDLEAGKV
jgi:succinate dehydrogenase / fumarate reductase flavoprotein subunit